MAEVNARKRGSKWQYYFDVAKVDGKRKRIVKSGFDTKKEALKAGADAMSLYNNGGVPVLDDSISVQDFANEYLEYYKGKYKYITYCTDRDQLNAHFLKDYGCYRITSITERVAEEFVFSLNEKGLSVSTIKKHISRCKKMFDYAIKQKVLRENPFADVKVPNDVANLGSPHEYYTDNRIKDLLESYKDDPLEAVIMLGYHAGLRISEMCALTWDDVDIGERTININKQVIYRNKSYYFTTTKFHSNRVIKMDETLVEFLKELRKRQRQVGVFHYDLKDNGELVYGNDLSFILTQKDGRLMHSNMVHGRIHYAKITYDKPAFKPHDLRHTHCTKLIESGIDVKYVQKRLGHKSINTTLDVYHHLSNKLAESEDAKLNDLF